MQRKINWWKNQLQDTIKDEKIFLFLVCIFHLNVILRFSLSIPLYKAVLHYFPGVIFYVLLAMILHQIPWRSLKGLIERLFVILSGAISIADTFLYMQYRDYLSFEKISILLGTNPRTVKEFLALYAWQPKILIPSICVLVLLGKGLQTIHRISISDRMRRGMLTVVCLSTLSFTLVLITQSHKAYAVTGPKPELLTEVFRTGIIPHLPEVYTLVDVDKSYQENGSSSQSIAGMDKTLKLRSC